MREILQQDSPVLRQTAKAVPIGEITGQKIQTLLADLREALNAEYDGVGIAAPQLGESLRIFIISELVYQHGGEKSKDSRKTAADKTAKAAAKAQEAQEKELTEANMNGSGIFQAAKPLVFINPEILKSSKDKKALEEGCLSVRPLYGMVRRATKVTIRAYDENGRLFERGASGLLAQIFQHEVDHLNGVLFIDKAKNIHEMDVEENKRAIASKRKR